MKKHKHDLNTSTVAGTKFENLGEQRISFIAILVGILSIIIALSIGYITYQYTFKITEKMLHGFYLNKAKMLAAEVRSYKDFPDDTVLKKINTLWRESGDKPSDEYACMVDSNASLILHTKNPDTVGNYAGDNLVLWKDNPHVNHLLDLSKLQKDFVGGYISSKGQEQIAAFTPVPQRGWTIGVHRSKEVLAEEIRSSIWFLIVGFIAVCGFLMPTSLALLYVTFRSSYNKRRKVEDELRKHHDRLRDRTLELDVANKKLLEDINERERIEIQIRKLSRVVEQSPSIVVMTDTKGNIEYTNSKFTETTGYRFEEAVGKNTRILKSCETPQEVYDQLWKTITSGQEWRGEFSNRKKNGELFWESACIIPIKDNEGDITNFVAIKEDITERKRSDEALQASEERLRSLSMATFEGIVFNKEGVFLDCNEQFADLVGYKLDELVGIDGLTLVHPEDRELVSNMITTGSEEPYKLRLLCKDDSTKFVEAHAQMMLIKGERLRVTAFRDISEHKKMEEELLKMQKLESVGVLAGGIAHDFNNNLQSIVSCVALAKTYANPEDEIYRKLEEAKNVILQSKSLTQQLLTFSKGGEPVKNTISISELIKYSASLALSGSNVRCELGIPDSLSSVEADKGQLSQVICNLIINADQAMPEGGNIKVWAENINVVEKDQIPLQQGRYVKISVTDQGTGIPQEHLQKIFDPYFTTKEMGSGLGLATCYSIIKKHEGYISVESGIGVGTTFRIYLPASSKEMQGISATSEEKIACTALVDKKNEEKPSVSKGKVLLMDDEATIRLFNSQHLIYLKYEVETAEDGVEAIGLYKKAMESGKPFDAIIMDLTIPGGMGGKEAIVKLFEIDPEVRAIVASGYADDQIMAESNKYGFCGVLVKPYEIYELDEILQRVIIEVS